jgi:hypothetical protein
MHKETLAIMTFRKIGLALTAALALCAAPAYADTSIGGGVFWTHDGSTDFGLTGSYNLFGLPLVPIKIQVSGAVPFGNGGRFAASLEGEYQIHRFYAGAGLGAGRMNSFGSGGAMYDFFGGVRVAPFTSIQGRYYGAMSGSPGSSTYLGVAFGLK